MYVGGDDTAAADHDIETPTLIESFIGALTRTTAGNWWAKVS